MERILKQNTQESLIVTQGKRTPLFRVYSDKFGQSSLSETEKINKTYKDRCGVMAREQVFALH